MRIKYKAPGQLLFRRFWRVTNVTKAADGSFKALNKRGRELHLPAGMVVIVIP